MLLSHRPSPPGQLDTRADSPMREKAHAFENSSANRNTAHGLPTPATDVPSSGFTAVNGETAQRITSFPADRSSHEPSTLTNAPTSGQNTAPAYNLQSWRPEVNHDTTPEGPNEPREAAFNKRKRDDLNGDEGVENGGNDSSSAVDDRSPKRPMTILNSGGIHSPRQSSQPRAFSSERDDLEQPSTGTYVR